MYLRTRNKSDYKNAYPNEVIRIMRPQILNAWYAVKHHYKMRRFYGSQNARNWVDELKRIDASSGYSNCIEQLRG